MGFRGYKRLGAIKGGQLGYSSPCLQACMLLKTVGDIHYLHVVCIGVQSLDGT